ncbi:hypothetical protein L208DRAFT_1250945, partial [Tricholoma matsutake]
LGYRPAGYKPDDLDYYVYKSHCKHLLASACGHAALLAGGIVAHLAREVVRYEDVYYGPVRVTPTIC